MQRGLVGSEMCIRDRVKSVPVSKISSTLNISKSNTTPIIDKLIDYGLVHRYTDPNDRRKIRVELTNTALEIFDAFKNFARSKLAEKICNLSDDDLLEIHSCTCKLTDIFSKLEQGTIKKITSLSASLFPIILHQQNAIIAPLLWYFTFLPDEKYSWQLWTCYFLCIIHISKLQLDLMQMLSLLDNIQRKLLYPLKKQD
eukprot:TRINITY_DN11910_c0_g1_i1.p1 TRINITY_DN11910_c0_g1~~TRINITY_DN11910_c0_g1_i1.p1  ORF type:complete len:199 (+),score=17.01 TRINITY_DN11910_c0_g1_i1:102-698(+)